MIYNPGLLNKKITIITDKQIQDAEGFDTIKSKPLCTTWARIMPLRGRENYDNDVKVDKNYATITIRYRADITDKMLIKYGDDVYNILNIVDPNMAHESLELY